MIVSNNKLNKSNFHSHRFNYIRVNLFTL